MFVSPRLLCETQGTSTARRIAKSSLFLLVGQIVSLSVGFVYTIEIARYLGPTGFGVISLALVFTAI
jgi:O-antigen/teichoic acid export membrane protein